MKIYILYTGGTIGCVGDPLSPMSSEDFGKAFTALMTPSIEEKLPGTSITIEGFSSTLDSTNMQPSEWVLMAQRIVQKYDDYDNFLILHGTDTMAWTSSAISYMLPGLSKTVTVTGSQLPLFTESTDSTCGYQLRFNTDAVRNVLGAVQFFEMELPEVCLYFADTLFRGNRVVKSNASDFVAFASPNYHQLGTYGVIPTLFSQYVLPVPHSKSMGHKRNLRRVQRDLETIWENISSKSVLQIQTFPGYYSEDGSKSLLASMVKALKDVSPKLGGIIFESYGIGNIPSFSSMQEILGELHDDNVILADCTQVFAGGVDYNEYATGAWLKTKGVISGHDMTPIAAMAKLTILLALHPTESIETIENMMGESLVGELTSYYSLSGYQNDYLAPEESIFSINGNYELENDASGYLILYDVTGDEPIELWKQGCGEPGRLIMQGDNNLVFYDDNRKISWESDTATIGFVSYLKVGDDGSLKLYKLDTDEAWATIHDASDPGDNKKKWKRNPKRKRKPRTARR